ncbi:MAG: bifunctional DNA-formamidopyrimidine glycosylase/DNA-(apurinic or apyrimidinic site) lyase [Acidobacteria bacterium]|nr:bifunctional DNA-formamidopyrimidine glycosylase/DNA-(apurinic or apyrimidinic site) lyase [Acidobacteriota bacterium]
MPELPEVETVVRTLRPLVAGRRILGAELCGAGKMGQPPPAILRILADPPQKFCQAVCGAFIEDVERYGKNIVLHLRSRHGKKKSLSLWIHLGMTGRLTCEDTAEPRTRHTHLILSLDEPGRWLHYTDIRQFGRLRLVNGLGASAEELGPDPLEIPFEEFRERLRVRQAMVKSLLLDQRFLRGVGNIYADEGLFRAGLHPRTHAARLTRKQALALYQGMQETLRRAIEFCGSSISNYVDAQGRPGSFQRLHQVYRRTGQPCFRCGALIRKIQIASRSTHFCPRCQRARATARDGSSGRATR